MMIFSIVLGRSRSGVSLIGRNRASTTPQSLTSGIQRPSLIRAHLISHGNVPKEDLPDYILEKVKNSMADFELSPFGYHAGLLEYDGRISESNIHEIRLHAILSHEIRKQFNETPVEVSIQQVRRSLGISSASSSNARRELNKLFKESGCVFEDPQTNSGLQMLSESWGVAHHLHRNHRVKEMKTSSPELIEKLRREILSNRKLFAPSIYSDASVINDLVNQEIDKLLVKRFNL